ncbi:uncharacterized protein RHO25_012792 [Cercospora beticola]|uniref:Cyanovirin-N domain-containing protein n=1 Tax=Cercospora beticola TaxID=122368 RepID=A0ABZ0P8E1_CERBT|nr:hypothetical protein RHO25_012792 [Cercospora beticola]CAK1368002.1 unnamed protein product [Cercospora beticola]
MKWMNLLTLASLAGLASAKKQIVAAGSTNANSTELVRCVAELKAVLEEHPRTDNLTGYHCGESWWQLGGNEQWQPIKNNLRAFRKCENDLNAVALSGNDWFRCILTDMWGFRILAYSPKGIEVCWGIKGSKKHFHCRRPNTGN